MNNKIAQSAEYIKERWWVAVILVVLLLLFIIPSKTGLPGNHKNYNGSYAAGNKIFMNFLDDPKDVILFIERDSRLLWTLLSAIFGGSPAMSARVNQDTLTEVK
jgi:hypothetical protein